MEGIGLIPRGGQRTMSYLTARDRLSCLPCMIASGESLSASKNSGTAFVLPCTPWTTANSQQLTVVNLVDSSYCADPSKYISVLLLALRSMLQLEYPHVNILSKIDLIKNYAPLPFNLDFYTDVQDLEHLLPHLERSQVSPRFAKLNEAIVELVENFSLVAFEVLAVENKKSMMRVLQAIDRAGGYAFGSAEGAGDNVFAVAMRQGWGEDIDIQERWIDLKEEWDEKEQKEEEEAERERQRRFRMSNGEVDLDDDDD